MRCGGLRDACLFYSTFEGAERSGHTCDGDARHRSVDRSNACAAQKPEPRPGMPSARILPLKGVGKRNAAAALGLVGFSHHARARDWLLAQAGAKLSGNIKARSLEPLHPHDDRAVIEIRSLTRSCKPSLIRMPVPYRSWANKRYSPSRKPRMNHFIRGQHHRQAPRRPRSSDLLKPGQIRAQHLAVEEQQAANA